MSRRRAADHGPGSRVVVLLSDEAELGEDIQHTHALLLLHDFHAPMYRGRLAQDLSTSLRHERYIAGGLGHLLKLIVVCSDDLARESLRWNHHDLV